MGSNSVCASCRAHVYLDGVWSMASYADPRVRRCITTWKYYGDQAYKDVLQGWLEETIPFLTLPDRWVTVTHIPLHPRKRRARGFDQAEDIAMLVAEELGIPHASLLARTVFTEPQANRPTTERLVGDLDDIFVAVGSVPEHVLLCDDVFTTGMTMDAAAKVLKESGAKSVWGCTLARGSAS